MAPNDHNSQNNAEKRLFLDAYALIASTISSAAAGIVTYLLSARLFPSEVVGTAAGMTAALLLVSGISQLDLTNVLHRYLPMSGASAKRLILGIYGTVASSSLVLGALFVVLFGADIFGDERGFAVLWFAVSAAMWSVFNLQDQVLMGLGKAWVVPVENTIFCLARIGLLIAFVGHGPEAIFATWLLPVAVLLIVVSIIIRTKVYPAHRRRIGDNDAVASFQMVRRFAAGGYLGAISGLVLANLLPVLVISHLGSSSNAYFYMAWTVASTVDLVALNFGASLVVQGASHQEHVPHLLRSVLKKQAVVLVPCLLLLAVFAEPILKLGFGTEYANASHTMLTLLAFGLIPRLVWGVYIPAVRLKDDVREMAVSQSLTNVIVLVATIVGLYTHGLTGIGIGYFLAQFLILALFGPKLWPMMKDQPVAKKQEAV